MRKNVRGVSCFVRRTWHAPVRDARTGGDVGVGVMRVTGIEGERVSEDTSLLARSSSPAGITGSKTPWCR